MNKDDTEVRVEIVKGYIKTLENRIRSAMYGDGDLLESLIIKLKNERKKLEELKIKNPEYFI